MKYWMLEGVAFSHGSWEVLTGTGMGAQLVLWIRISGISFDIQLILQQCAKFLYILSLTIVRRGRKFLQGKLCEKQGHETPPLSPHPL